MRPENLKVPFKWDERCVLINDRVWYVPKHIAKDQKEFVFPGWDHPDLFGNNNPVRVEYCSGNGAWIAEKAVADPLSNWVAVEKKFVRARKIWSKVKNLKLNNLIVICGEGHNATQKFFPSQSIQDIFINFPDPWPKTRHAKNRIIQPAFIEEMARSLKDKMMMTFVTDDPDYSHWMVKTMKSSMSFTSVHADPHYITELEGYGSSYFDQLWREKGKVIRYHQFVKGM